MELEEFRQEELKRFLMWVSKNRKIWLRMCDGEIRTAIDYEMILKMLIDEKFYIAIAILFTANSVNMNVTDFFIELGLEKMSESLDENMKKRLENYMNEVIESGKEEDRILKKKRIERESMEFHNIIKNS